MTHPHFSTPRTLPSTVLADRLLRDLFVHGPGVLRSVSRDHALEIMRRGERKPLPRLRKPRRPTLTSVANQAAKAAIPVVRYEIKLDGTIAIITGEPEPAAPENPWPLDEFCTKETKQ